MCKIVSNTIYAEDNKVWRKWLIDNHISQKEIWLLYYKKHTSRPSISYNEAVEEALCFGWIDSTVRGIDEVSYCQKFTPRKLGSRWSESNIIRAKEMIALGKMTSAGMILYQKVIDNKSLIIKNIDNTKDLNLPDKLTEVFEMNENARIFFLSSSRSYKNMCIRWLESAKKEETQKKRIKEILDKSIKQKKIGMK